MNWDDPRARARLIKRIGPQEYNRRYLTWIDSHPKVNGWSIVPTQTLFGLLFSVHGSGMAFATEAEAAEYAREN